MRQVVVRQPGRDDVVVLSTSPGVVGDEFTLDVAGAPPVSPMRVAVTASRPIALDGAIYYELRLRPLESM